MRRNCLLFFPLLLLVFAMFCTPSFAQSCTGSTCAATSCSESAVLAALPSSSNTNSTVTVNIPACSATWSTSFSYTQPPAVTTLNILGAGTPSSGSGTTGASSSCGATQLTDNSGSSNFMWKFVVNNGQNLRLSCMDIEPASNSTALTTPIMVLGTCTSSVCPQLRIDNMWWGNTTRWTESGNGAGASWMTRVDNVFGVMDHNTIPPNSQVELVNVNHSGYLGIGSYGDNSWAQPDSLGGANVFYVENNLWYNTSAGGMAMQDCDTSDSVPDIGGCRVACRYNDVFAQGNGVGVCVDHGTETTGRPRGGRQVEVYNNTINCTNGSLGCAAVEVVLLEVEQE